jgi:hypothetical protein
MAVYFHKTLIRSADYIKVSKHFSSVKAIRRSHKKGTFRFGQDVGGIQMVDNFQKNVSRFYGIRSWEGVLTVPNGKSMDGLTPLSRIRKITGNNEQLILSWAMLNYIDVYWAAGTFFANLHAVEQCAKAQKELIDNPPPAPPSTNIHVQKR